jgi:hypothetical protein
MNNREKIKPMDGEWTTICSACVVFFDRLVAVCHRVLFRGSESEQERLGRARKQLIATANWPAVHRVSAISMHSIRFKISMHSTFSTFQLQLYTRCILRSHLFLICPCPVSIQYIYLYMYWYKIVCKKSDEKMCVAWRLQRKVSSMSYLY